MFSKKDKIFRTIRIVLDVINVIFCVCTVALVVYTFLDVRNRMNIFPYIFYAGAAVNVVTGGKHMVSDNVLRGLGNWVIAGILVAISSFVKVIVGGML